MTDQIIGRLTYYTGFAHIAYALFINGRRNDQIVKYAVQGIVQAVHNVELTTDRTQRSNTVHQHLSLLFQLLSKL